MALQKQLVPIPFGAMDAGKTDPKLLPTGALTLVENMRSGRDGELEKRYGMTSVAAGASSGTISSASSLSSLGGEILLETPTTLYSRATANGTWYSRGASSQAAVTVKGVAAGDRRHQTVSCAYLSGYVLSAWHDPGNGGIYYSVVDQATGAILVPETLVANRSAATLHSPKVVTIGSSFHIYYAEIFVGGSATASRIFVNRVQVATPTTLSAQTTVCVDGRVAGANATYLPFDVIVPASPNNDRVVVVYARESGGTQYFGFAYLDESLASVGTGSTTAANILAIGCMPSPSGAANYIAVAHDAGGTYSMRVYDLNFGSGVALVATIRTSAEIAYTRNVTGYYTGSAYQVFWQVYRDLNDYTSPVTTSCGLWSGTGAGTGALWIPNAQLTGHAFTLGGSWYLPIGYYMKSPSYQGSYFIVDTSKNIVAKYLNGEGGASWDAVPYYSTGLSGAGASGTLFCTSQLSRISAISSTSAALPSLRLNNIADLGFQACYAEFSIAPTRTGAPRVINDQLAVPGGTMRAYESSTLSELGFHAFPETPSVLASGGGSVDAGVHQYCLVWSWRDALGNAHRSAPSVPVSITISNPNNTVTVRWQELNLTNKQSVLLEIYRTTAGGTAFYRLPSPTPDQSINTALVVPAGYYTDTVADSSITSQPLLYTTGGVLENDGPPAARSCCVAGNRLWLFGLDDPHMVWFSKEAVGGEGIAFSAAQVIRADDDLGVFTCGAALDDKVILFKDRGMYVVYGEGPDDTGNGSYSTPQALPLKVGTDNPKSVLETPQGIFFSYEGTIYCLSRGLDVTPIGLPVVDYTASATIVGAVAWPEEHEARFYTSGGRTLVYNWDSQLWTTFTGQAASGATRWGDDICFVSTTGIVWKDDTTKYYDGSATAIVSKATTGWINLAGLQGYQRLYTIQVLGEYKAAHSLKVSIWYDYATGTASETWTKAVSAGPQRLEIKPSRQKCSAFQLQVEDVYAAASTEGFRLTGVTCVVGMKQGRGRGVTTIAP